MGAGDAVIVGVGFRQQRHHRGRVQTMTSPSRSVTGNDVISGAIECGLRHLSDCRNPRDAVAEPGTLLPFKAADVRAFAPG